MCRASKNGKPGRRCKNPSHMSDQQRDDFNAQRREKYRNKILKAQQQQVLTESLQADGIRVVHPEDMITTLWYTSRREVFSREYSNSHETIYCKPKDSMWTAPSLDESHQRSSWTQWYEDNGDYYDGKTGYLTEVKPIKEAVIIEIQDEKSLQRVYDRYKISYALAPGFDIHGLDFEKMRQDGIDAIYVSVNPNWLYVSVDGSAEEKKNILYGWDLSSVAWMNRKAVITGKRHVVMRSEDEIRDQYYQDWGYDEDDSDVDLEELRRSLSGSGS